MILIISGMFIYERNNVTSITHADILLPRKLFIVHMCFENIVGVKQLLFFFFFAGEEVSTYLINIKCFIYIIFYYVMQRFL